MSAPEHSRGVLQDPAAVTADVTHAPLGAGAARAGRNGIRGSLADVPVIDVLKVLTVTRQTGRLCVNQWLHRATLEFHQGRVVSGSIRPGPRHVAGVLMSRGWVDLETLHHAVLLQAQRAPRPRIGQLLLELRAIDLTQLTTALSEHLRGVLRDLLQLRWGRFEYVPMPIQAGHYQGLTVDSPLLEAMLASEEERASPWLQRRGTERVAFLWSQDLLLLHGLPVELEQRQVMALPVASTDQLLSQLLAVDDAAPVAVIDADLFAENPALDPAALERLCFQWPNVRIVLFGRRWSGWVYEMLEKRTVHRLLPRPDAEAEASFDVLRAFLRALAGAAFPAH